MRVEWRDQGDHGKVVALPPLRPDRERECVCERVRVCVCERESVGKGGCESGSERDSVWVGEYERKLVCEREQQRESACGCVTQREREYLCECVKKKRGPRASGEMETCPVDQRERRSRPPSPLPARINPRKSSIGRPRPGWQKQNSHSEIGQPRPGC